MRTLIDKALGFVFFWFLRTLVYVIGKTYFRVEIQGRELLPPSGPYLLCPTHRSNLDGPLTCLISLQRIRYMIKKEAFSIRPIGYFLRTAGGVPVDRQGTSKEAISIIARHLVKGAIYVVFPEGTRKSGTTVDTIHTGPAFLALKAKCPLVAVGIYGSEEANPKGSPRFYPKKITIRVGATIQTPKVDRVDRATLSSVTEQLRVAMEKVQVEVTNDCAEKLKKT